MSAREARQRAPQERPTHERPPQAPAASRAERWLGPLAVTGALAYRANQWLAASLPDRWLPSAVRLGKSVAYRCLPGIRRAIGNNLEAVLGPCDAAARAARIRQTLEAYAWCSSEHFRHMAGVADLAIKGTPLSLAPEQGAVLVTAHVGAWEIGSLLPPTSDPRTVHVVRDREIDPRVERDLAARLRAAGGPRMTFHFGLADLATTTRLVAALRRGELVALQADRPQARARQVEATLFGRPLAFPAGPAALARAAGVDIIPAFVFRTERQQLDVIFRPPISVPRGTDSAAELARATQRIASEIEWAIRRHPHQWFCFRDLWPPTRP